MPASRWDLAAIKAGALVALVFAIPLSIGSRIAADDGDGGLAVWLAAGALVGFTLGAGCAAWVQQRGTPLSHGIVTAGGTYLGAQTVFVGLRLLRAQDVHWFAIAFTLSFVLVAGLVGGVLGERLRARGFEASTRKNVE